MRGLSRPLQVHSIVACWFWVSLFVVLAGCAQAAETTVPSPITPATSTRVQTPSTNETITRRATTRSPITTNTAITLTLWTTEEFAPTNTPAGRILRSQFDAFTAAHPNIYIRVVLKSPAGKGGILDFLQTTHAVVPERPLGRRTAADVPLAAERGVLQSLEGWLPAELNTDLFPFAARAARYQNQWVALPFIVDTRHLVYNKTVVKKPPKTWDEFYRQKQQIILPLAGDDTFWSQYAAMTAVNNPASLDWGTATQVLTFVKRARDLGLLNDASIAATNADEAWTPFAAGQVLLAETSAARFLAEQAKSPNAHYASLPTRDGKSAPLASGKAFAMVVRDPARQSAVARFINWIVAGEHLAPWLRAASRLPAVRSTLWLAIDDREYAAFMREELDNAVYLPRTTAYLKVSEAWRVAVAGVWKGQTTPEEAARTIVAAK